MWTIFQQGSFFWKFSPQGQAKKLEAKVHKVYCSFTVFTTFPTCIFEDNTIKTKNLGHFWLSLITISLYTWQRKLCARNRFNEPAKAFQHHSEERIVCDFSCALGISSPVGIFPRKCRGIRLSVQYGVLLEKKKISWFKQCIENELVLFTVLLPFEHRSKANFYFPSIYCYLFDIMGQGAREVKSSQLSEGDINQFYCERLVRHY